MSRRERRRAFRPSDAESIDRSADQVDPRWGAPVDDDRAVILDPDQQDVPSEDEFWREQRPPHY